MARHKQRKVGAFVLQIVVVVLGVGFVGLFFMVVAQNFAAAQAARASYLTRNQQQQQQGPVPTPPPPPTPPRPRPIPKGYGDGEGDGDGGGGGGGDEYERELQQLRECSGDIGQPMVNMVVGTRNRTPMLSRMLASVARFREVAHMCNWRVVVMDQGSSDADVAAVVAAWSAETGVEGVTLQVVVAPGTVPGFMRAGSLRQGMEWVYAHYPDEIVFMGDVDMDFPLDFLMLVRHYCVRKREVFFPICFSLYEDRAEIVSAENGFWRDYGYGMSGMYAADGVQLGVYAEDANRTVHGREDNRSFWLLIEHKIKVNRPMVHGFYHRFHHRAVWFNSTNGIDGTRVPPAQPWLG